VENPLKPVENLWTVLG